MTAPGVTVLEAAKATRTQTVSKWKRLAGAGGAGGTGSGASAGTGAAGEKPDQLQHQQLSSVSRLKLSVDLIRCECGIFQRNTIAFTPYDITGV